MLHCISAYVTAGLRVCLCARVCVLYALNTVVCQPLVAVSSGVRFCFGVFSASFVHDNLGEWSKERVQSSAPFRRRGPRPGLCACVCASAASRVGRGVAAERVTAPGVTGALLCGDVILLLKN